MNTLFRHRNLPREEDGAIELRRLKLEFASRFTSSRHWSIRSWISHLERGGGHKKRFQHCIDPNADDTVLYLRALGRSGGNPVDPSLQDNVMILKDFLWYIYRVGNSHDLHSTIKSGLIEGERDAKKERHTVFFTAVDPLQVHLHEQRGFDLSEPRIAVYKRKWKVHQILVYCINLKFA